MEWMQKELRQPNIEAKLIRYMDEWKFELMKEEGVPFTQVSSQSDIYDGMMIGDNGGYARFNNNRNERGYRSFNYISCWTLDNEPTLEKIRFYCDDHNKPRYAVMTSYQKLVGFCKDHIRYDKSHMLLMGNYFLYGKVEYCECSTYNEKPWQAGKSQLSYFMKRKKYESENEFRLLLFPARGISIPYEGNYIMSSEIKPPICTPLYGELQDFAETVYKLNPRSNKFEKEIIKL